MNRLLILLPVFALIFSCNSNDDTQAPQPEADNFYALKVGNSWVYKNYKYNSNTQLYDNTGVIDSVSIVDTEDFNGETYFKFRRWTTGNEANITFCNENGEHFEYFRDSLGYLIRNDGSIKFVNNNYEERIIAESGSIISYEKLMDGSNPLTVEAGVFECINSERYALLEGDIQLPGLDKFYYSYGFGLIYDTSSFANQETPFIIRRLDAYQIQ